MTALPPAPRSRPATLPARRGRARRAAALCVALAGAAVGLLARAAPAAAQMNMPPANTYPQDFYVPGLGDMDTAELAERARRGGPVPPIARVGHSAVAVVGGAAPGPADADDAPFRVSLERRRANLARFVAGSRAADPRGAARLERLFAQGDVIAAFSRELAPLGLRVDRLADAYAVYWVNAWQAAHHDTSTPGRATAQAVRAQAARALLATPQLRAAGDAERQAFAEALLVQAALIAAAQAQYRADPAAAARFAAAVREGAQASGLDLDAMTLTARGFAPAAGAGVGPSVGAGDRTADGDAGTAAPDGLLRILLREGMDVGTAGFMTSALRCTLLYRDGRAVEPGGRAGRWQRPGPDAVRVVWADGDADTWTRINRGGDTFDGRPAPAGHRLDGLYTSEGGSGTPDVTVVNNRAIRFRADGTFSLTATGGGSGYGSTAASGRRDEGRYALAGHTLTLTFADGRREQRIFYRLTDATDVVGIGTAAGMRVYIRQ